MNENYDLTNDYTEKLGLGHALLQSLSPLQNSVGGINKLKTKIKQEIAFLEKVEGSKALKKEHLVCSNIHHYKALTQRILSDPSAVATLQNFNFEYGGAAKKIHVDIVCDEKLRWVKVVARNPKALSLISKGDGEYQQKSILHHANEFLECASQNLVLFKPPIVEFHFACGVENELAGRLSSIGVLVTGHVVDESDETSISPISPERHLQDRVIKKLNLDVTAMIAYVSALTNGKAHKKIRGKLLTAQAEWERARPVKPILEAYFQGKELYACHTVLTTFRSILEAIGGVGEKERGEDLLKKVKEVPDAPCVTLKPVGQIKPRSIIIFGTGKAIEAITVTANSAFVRAARHQGVNFDCFLHEARPLTERKIID